MGTDIFLYIEFVRHPPRADESVDPFVDGEIWDFSNDVSLSRGKDYNFIGALYGARLPPDKAPLYKPRGVPDSYQQYREYVNRALSSRTGSARLTPKEKLLFNEDEVSYLYPDEVEKAVRHVGMTRSDFYSQTQLFLELFDRVVEEYGPEYVRLVFQVGSP